MLSTIAPYCAQVKTIQKAAFKGRGTPEEQIAKKFADILRENNEPSVTMDNMGDYLSKQEGYGKLASAFKKEFQNMKLSKKL